MEAFLEGLYVAFIGVAAFNVTAAVVAFLSAFFSRRGRDPISWLRGGLVLLGGWLLGSMIVLVLQVIGARIGFIIHDNNPIETVVALCVLLPTMFFLLDLSRPKQMPVSPHEHKQPNL